MNARKPSAPPRPAATGPHLRQGPAAAALLAPLLLFVLALIALPVLGTLNTSLFRDVSFLDRSWAGAENYRSLLDDAGFAQALVFTLLFIAASVPLELAMGLAFALLLHRPSRVRGLLRACMLVPWAIPAAVSGRAWELIYNYSYGLANYLLLGAGLSDLPINWLGTPAGAFAAVVLADAWKTTPFVTILLLAGLQTVPGDLYEQARIDGASAWQQFWKITLPLLRPVVVAALLFRTVDAVRVFDLIYVLTGGGPGGSTSSVSLYAYRYFISGDLGYGSAASVLLFAVSFVLALAYVRIGGAAVTRT